MNDQIKIGTRLIRDGQEYDYLFPRAQGNDIVIKRFATLEDTVQFLPIAVQKTLNDTKAISALLKGSDVRETCRKVWEFCYHHFQYKRDKKGVEQIRRPSRAWKDRRKGIDCDCFSTFICSVLTNLGIKSKMRITAHSSEEFEHVYPIVSLPDGKTIAIDCVINQFDHQVPFIRKRDIPMELHFLNGPGDREARLPEANTYANDLSVDAEDLLSGVGELGLFKKLRTKIKENKAERKAQGKPTGLKRLVHSVNKVNPVTALMRAGVLASMKLNLMGVASKLRFSYLSPAQARAKGMDMNKYNRLQGIRAKLEKIFYGAGGKPVNFQRAILSGKGNRDRAVQLNGLGMLNPFISEYSELRTIIGEDIYADEFKGVALDGLGVLGEPATGAAIAAASAVIASIKKLLQQLGPLFRKGTAGARQEAAADSAAEMEQANSVYSNKAISRMAVNRLRSDAVLRADTGVYVEPDPFEQAPDLTQHETFELQQNEDKSEDENHNTDSAGDEKGGVMKWAKENPVAATAAGVSILGLLGWGIHTLVKAKKAKGMNGPGTKRKSSQKKSTRKKKRTSPKRSAGKQNTRKKSLGALDVVTL